VLLRFLSFFFFFQAEDGIRDRNVTGVQTCALPISLIAPPGGMGDYLYVAVDTQEGQIQVHLFDSGGYIVREGRKFCDRLLEETRSEERRVGKECRYRWSRNKDETKDSRVDTRHLRS